MQDDDVDLDLVRREAAIMSKLVHKSIVRLVEIYEDDESVAIVLE